MSQSSICWSCRDGAIDSWVLISNILKKTCGVVRTIMGTFGCLLHKESR